MTRKPLHTDGEWTRPLTARPLQFMPHTQPFIHTFIHKLLQEPAGREKLGFDKLLNDTSNLG